STMSWARCRILVLAAAVTALVGAALVMPAPSKGVTFPNLTKLSPPGGWTTDNYVQHYSTDITGEQFSSAAVGDLDLNGVQDVVAGFPDGMVYAWRTDNGARWF